MSIETGYVNGEKVYIHNRGSHISGWGENILDYDEVQIFRHKDIVKMLNKFLRRLEDADNETMKRNACGQTLFGILSQFAAWDKADFTAFKIVREDALSFDDPRTIKMAKCPRLRNESRIDQRFLKPIVVKGGLYEHPKTPAYAADDLISDEFKRWQRAQRSNPDHNND